MHNNTGPRHHRLFPTLSALAAVLTVLACQPFVESGFNDDWGYAYLALNFARTGHFSYGVLSAPTILFQTWWGSLLIHFFGFSFQLLRFSTLPFAIGCAVFSYRLAVMAGLPPESSLFTSLALVTSPVFTPLAASFMSDVYGCFFTLLCLFLGASAAAPFLSARARVLRLTASTLAGCLGGLERQTVYIAAAAVLLWAIWHWRTDRTLRLAVGLLLLVLAVAASLMLRWQAQQPLAGGMMVIQNLSWRRFAAFPAESILTITLLIFPAAISLRKRGLPAHWRAYALSSLVVVGGLFYYWRVSHQALFPWMPNILTSAGILHSGEEMRGARPLIFGHTVQFAVTLAVLIVLIRVGALLLVSPLRGTFRRPLPTLQLILIFGVIYAACLLVQARVVTFDRYLLPVLPIALIAALLVAQRSGIASPSAPNWFLLAIFAFYGIATSHDYFAALQARVTAFQALQARGIASRNISGGLELDGWTQAQIASRIYYPDPKLTTNPGGGAGFWFLSYTPDVRPLYSLSWSDEPGMIRAPIPAVSFDAWLPPFRREVRILVPATKP
jgi:hypothetical protein